MARSPAKKQKWSKDSPFLHSLAVHRCTFPTADLTPGPFQGCRAAIQTYDGAACKAFLGNGSTVYSTALEISPAGSHVQGLDGVCLPSACHDAAVQPLQGFTLPAEVQSISVGRESDGNLLAAVDLYGAAKLQNLSSSGDLRGSTLTLRPANASMPLSPSPKRKKGKLVIYYPDSDPQTSAGRKIHLNFAREAGWAGVVASQDAGCVRATTACHYGKCLTAYNGNQVARHAGTLHGPNDMVLMSGSRSGTVAVAEGHQVSLWDWRAAEKNGCVARLHTCSVNLPLYALAADSSGNIIGCGGAESTAFLIDIRKPALPFDRWASCLKYDILAMHFPTQGADHIFVAGADQEVRCGLTDSKARKTLAQAQEHSSHGHTRSPVSVGSISFRGDSRWLGFAKAPSQDVFAGFSASKSILLAHVGFKSTAENDKTVV